MSTIPEHSIQALINNKTKPLGALGELESIAFQICKYQNTLSPALNNPHMLVFAADHGLSCAGVSAYPKEVTAQMLLNFVGGGAAINVFCRQHQIALDVVDAGVDFDFDPTLTIEHCKVAAGTNNCLQEAAMTSCQLEKCFEYAKALIRARANAGCNVIGFGEMGIGNTSSAALILHYLLKLPMHECVGRGTGLNNEQLAKKLETLCQVAKLHGELNTPNEILQAVGGFEIAMMTQAMLSAYEQGMLILVDGFIASAAALLATRTNPSCRRGMIFCHQSEESGHIHMLTELNAQPILKMGMRLGEGSGCALAYPILKSAVNFVNEMASFESAEISTQHS